MPLLERPDGAQIWWEQRGDGPGVLVCNTFNLGHIEELLDRLATERRALSYEPRGLGRSSRNGPYDLDTGVADLIAVLEEAGGVDVALGIGDGAHRAIRAAVERPDLIDRVVFTSTALGRVADDDTATGFAASTEVLSALMSLLRRDYRTGLRSMVGGSRGFDEDSERERVEELAAAVPQEAALGYLEAWIAAGSAHEARELGGRLTVLAYAGNDWFPLALYESMREYLTAACFEFVEDGPLSRPDLAADVLLRVSEPARG